MKELTVNDLNFVLTRFPKDLMEVVKENGLIIAGGFIRSTIAGERVSDYDLFGSSKEKLEGIAYKLATRRKGRVHVTDNAYTLLSPPRIPIQFITRWLFTDPLAVAQSFDFTVCQAAIWYSGDKWYSSVSDNFYSDLAARRLVYTAPERNEDAGGSLLRARKFLMRGYSIQSSSLAGVVARLLKGFDTSETSLEEEHLVSRVLTGLLREVDPMLVIDGVDMVDEHEIIQE